MSRYAAFDMILSATNMDIAGALATNVFRALPDECGGDLALFTRTDIGSKKG